MKKFLDNNKGITLVELLAVLALLSLILVIVYGIFISGQKQYKTQEGKIQNQENVQYVIKHVTKEIRKANEFQVVDENTLFVDTVLYSWSNNVLYITSENQTEILAESIKNFIVEPDVENNNKLILFVESIGSERTKSKIKTELYIREEDSPWSW